MSGNLKVGDVCIIVIKPNSCAHCVSMDGKECTIASDASLAIRLGCSGAAEIGAFYDCNVPGHTRPLSLHRTELRKKDPPADPAGWVRQETIPRVRFDEWLERVRKAAPVDEPA